LLYPLIRGIRLKQATKNLFVFAALVFTGQLFDPAKFWLVLQAFILFTIVAGSIYLLNDLLDVEQDRLHPEKRKRPLASGELPVPLAWIAMVTLSIGGLAYGFVLRPLFGLTLLSYFVLQIAYCFALKRMVLVDVFTIAAGFVLRTVAGGFVLHVHISQWLLLCSLQLALFLGFGKRRQEIATLGPEAGRHRAILSEYSLPFLDQMINLVAGITVVCYSVYSVESETAKQHPHLWVTVPMVIFSICRYLYLVYQKGWGGAPDEALLKDRVLQGAILLWFLTVLALFVGDRAGQPLLRGI
jgi:4-hydroxybenzoate polyprenyltransferase